MDTYPGESISTLNSTIENAYGVKIEIQSDQIRHFVDNSDADNKVDIFVSIDGVEKVFTLQEFKDKLGFLPNPEHYHFAHEKENNCAQ